MLKKELREFIRTVSASELHKKAYAECGNKIAFENQSFEVILKFRRVFVRKVYKLEKSRRGLPMVVSMFEPRKWLIMRIAGYNKAFMELDGFKVLVTYCSSIVEGRNIRVVFRANVWKDGGEIDGEI